LAETRIGTGDGTAAVLAASPAPGAVAQARAPSQEIDLLLHEISADSVAFNEKLVATVGLLSGMGAWCEIVRLLVGVGGYQLSEIAEAVGVMRSTATRWYNGETRPSQDMVPVYAERLLAYMKPTRPFDLRAGGAALAVR
jgi:hypothetical protein